MATQVNYKTPVWQVRAFQNWVKTVMVSEMVEPGMKVCEFCCGTGLEIGKWDRAKVGDYTGIDESATSLSESEDRWKKKNKPFSAEFRVINLFTTKLDTIENPLLLGTYDVVGCFEGMQRSFESEDKARTFLYNASKMLKIGGIFFGLLPDSSEIWYKSQKVTSGLPMVKGTLFSAEFPTDDFTNYGSTYTFKLGDGTVSNEYLVHFPSLIKLAKEYDLQMLGITNLNEFYEDNRKNYADKLKAMAVLDKKGKILAPQMEIIGLYTTFVFLKVDANTITTTT